jgi:hypothetical protein
MVVAGELHPEAVRRKREQYGRRTGNIESDSIVTVWVLITGIYNL